MTNDTDDHLASDEFPATASSRTKPAPVQVASWPLDITARHSVFVERRN